MTLRKSVSVLAAVIAAVMLRPSARALASDTSTAVQAQNVQAKIALASGRVAPGHDVGVTVDIAIEPGWHIYGNPVPEDFVATSVAFDSPVIAKQQIKFPPPTPVKFEGLGQTLPVYEKSVRAAGTVMIDPKSKPGDYQIAGTFKFQECNDNICKIPQAVKFE
ncbi:MAG TPA: protein-disulfide reductase DsbD domain-containing protein, partial [Candidatus Binataceae bacterium]|nr:protein-disulfide reductase DsbD domain-containing protein [Candidatus Binataceae bacterium]